MNRITVLDKNGRGPARRRWFDLDSAVPYFARKGPGTPTPRGYECLYHTATGRWVWHYEHTEGCRGDSKYRFITSREARDWLETAGLSYGSDYLWISRLGWGS
jgi:hypothetical protein